MRNIIAGMQSTLDGKITGPDGYADWVPAWSDNYGIMSRVDACLLGAGMYQGYEQYWSAIQERPDQPLPMTGRLPTPAEVEYARFATRTPHYVLSSTLTSAAWPNTRFLRRSQQVDELKRQPGRNIYLVGGARSVASLLDAGLIDELCIAFHPLVVGQGTSLFMSLQGRRALVLRSVEQREAGRVYLTYAVEPAG